MNCLKCGRDTGDWALCREHYKEAKEIPGKLETRKVEISRVPDVMLRISAQAFEKKDGFWMAFLNGFCIYVNNQELNLEAAYILVEYERMEHIFQMPDHIVSKRKYLGFFPMKGQSNKNQTKSLILTEVPPEQHWRIPRSDVVVGVVEGDDCTDTDTRYASFKSEQAKREAKRENDSRRDANKQHGKPSHGARNNNVG